MADMSRCAISAQSRRTDRHQRHEAERSQHKALVEIICKLRQLIAAETEADGPPDDAELARNFVKETDNIFEHLKRSELRCPVVGITKAGKSALLNGLLRADLLPSTNVPATSTCIRIRHTPGATSPTLSDSDGILAEDVPGVRHALWSLSGYGSRGKSTPDDDLMLDVSFPFLERTAPAQSLQFVLVDTPGVTEADAAGLVQATLAALRESDAVILACSYAQLQTRDERQFLERCGQTRADIFRHPGRSFFCVVTKMDLKNRHGADLSSVERLIRDQLGCALGEHIRQQSQFLWPVRAELGLLARLVAAGAADEAQRADYLKIVLGSQRVARQVTAQALCTLANDSVEFSGLLGVETMLRERVAARSASIRHKAVHGRLMGLIDDAYDWAHTARRPRLQKQLSRLLEAANSASEPIPDHSGGNEQA